MSRIDKQKESENIIKSKGKTCIKNIIHLFCLYRQITLKKGLN